LTNAFQPVIPAIKDSLAQLTPVIGTVLDQLAPSLGNLLAALLPVIGQLLTALTPVLVPILDAIAQTIPTLAPVLAPLGAALGEVIKALVPILPIVAKVVVALADSLAPVFAALAPIIAALIPPLAEVLFALLPLLPPLSELLVALSPLIVLVAQLAGWIVKLLNFSALTPIISVLTVAIDALSATVKFLTGLFTDTDWTGIGRTIGGAFTGAWDAVKAFFGDIVGFFTELPGKISEKAREWGSALLQLGKDIVRGIVKGITDAAGSIGSALLDAVKGGWNAVTGFLGISSPSKLFAQVGEDTVAGYVAGVQRSAHEAAMAQTGALAPAAGLGSQVAAAPSQVTYSSSDPFVASAIAKIKEEIRTVFGGDVTVALGTVSA
jgi:phage-related protein